jgi:hypothetical protein
MLPVGQRQCEGELCANVFVGNGQVAGKRGDSVAQIAEFLHLAVYYHADGQFAIVNLDGH